LPEHAARPHRVVAVTAAAETVAPAPAETAVAPAATPGRPPAVVVAAALVWAPTLAPLVVAMASAMSLSKHFVAPWLEWIVPSMREKIYL
jgi:hypothetical protein